MPSKKKLSINFSIIVLIVGSFQFQGEEAATQAGILSFYGEEDHPDLASEHESLDDMTSGGGSLVASEENALLHGNVMAMTEEPVEGDNSNVSEWVRIDLCVLN